MSDVNSSEDLFYLRSDIALMKKNVKSPTWQKFIPWYILAEIKEFVDDVDSFVPHYKQKEVKT